MGAIETPTRLKLSIDQYYRMAEAGVLAPQVRVELIDGAIYEMAPLGSLHAALVDQLHRVLLLRLHPRAIVGCQRPVRLFEFSEPVPDIAVIRPREDGYRARHPDAGDVLLLIEVADTSLRFDSTIKRALYAGHGIREYWTVDAQARTIEVCRDPTGDGYTSIERLDRQGRVNMLAFPDEPFDVGVLLPE
jgi:Uma2 family endonuclease